MLALIITMTARVIDYPIVIMCGAFTLLASSAGLVVSIRQRHTSLAVVAGIAGVMAVLVIIAGLDAMGQYQDVVRELGGR
jgi:hypothetical protein